MKHFFEALSVVTGLWAAWFWWLSSEIPVPDHRRLGGCCRNGVCLTELHEEPHLVIVDVAAGHREPSFLTKKRILTADRPRPPALILIDAHSQLDRRGTDADREISRNALQIV